MFGFHMLEGVFVYQNGMSQLHHCRIKTTNDVSNPPGFGTGQLFTFIKEDELFL